MLYLPAAGCLRGEKIFATQHNSKETPNKLGGSAHLMDPHTHPLYGRSGTLECKAELRCRSLHQSSASESSHTFPVFQLIDQLDAENDR